MAVIQSIQAGAITITAGNNTNTATISSVTTAKAMARLTGSAASGGASSAEDTKVRIELTNATTVGAFRGGTTGQVTVNYEVIEYT